MQNELVIVDSSESEILRATDDGDGEIEVITYDADDFATATSLDAGGVAALTDWLNAWLERREAGAVDGRQPALLGDG